MGDVDTAPPAPIRALDEAPFRPKSSLMKKLGLLLLPKKSKSKSGSPSQKPAAPPLPPPSSGPGTELELLFAQAEATLGELLVRAGASFEARSSSYSHAESHRHHHHPAGVSDRSLGEDGVSALIMGGSSTTGSRSAKFSGHARRRSLSRVWQQLGGSLFCGSGHMNAYVMDHDMMPRAPSKGLYEDVVLDEAYWQSLADAMILQQQEQSNQQQQQGAKLASDGIHSQHELSCRSTKEVQNDEQQGSTDHGAENLQIAEVEEDRCESEIVPSIDAESMAKLEWASPTRGSSGRSSLQDMDSMYYRNLVGGEGGTRLNTTLDESPNLAHNYLVTKVAGTSSGSYRPEARDMGAEMQAMQPGSSSMQPLESFLWQARSDVVAGPSNLVSGSASSRSAPDSFTCQEPAGFETSGTASCRVSLMTLLHEEATAGEPTARPEEDEEAEAAALLEEDGRRTRSMMSTSVPVAVEDPLQCCVCMIRRKGAALIPCGHTFCRTCAKQLFAGRGACPLCNNLIVQVLDIF